MDISNNETEHILFKKGCLATLVMLLNSERPNVSLLQSVADIYNVGEDFSLEVEVWAGQNQNEKVHG